MTSTASVMSDERAEELDAIAAIYPELTVSAHEAELDIAVKPAEPILIRFIPSAESQTDDIRAHIESDVHLDNLPPLHLKISLPPEYPDNSPPKVHINTPHDWLDQTKITTLEQDIARLWEEYGRCQIVFAYIDHIQQSADQGFDLNSNSDGCFTLPKSLEPLLVQFDQDTKRSAFNASTYNCGVCLEPKKGVFCYQLHHCKHVFCRTCLQDFYENAIKEGDVNTVRCLDPDCGKDSKSKRLLHPRELLAMGLDESSVRRMVEMKRKKKREADKTTVYCPRSWCQAPARNIRYPPIPADLNDYIEVSDDEASDESTDKPNGEDQRLAVCEKCTFAFCRTCCASWHGSFVRCYPRDSTELSAEEQASYDYIRKNTSPCPTCNSPTQKTMGCNHMHCFQCQTHFCYLCGAWLDGSNPYIHFNTGGSSCYQRLWELEEGDEGQRPADGQGFLGARGWEAIALEVAREAERQEAEEATRAGQDIPGHNAPVRVAEPPPAIAVPVGAQARPNDNNVEAQDHDRRRQGRRRWHGPPRRPGDGAAVAVRAHERQRPRRPPQQAPAQPEPAMDEDDELRRFIELALRDEEDGWDSDELADDDEAWRIR